jgi:nicotinate-nucleotide adenylyltransferase
MKFPQAEICMMPSGQPMHRAKPHASPEQRLKMLQLALGDTEVIRVDDYEVKKDAESYSIETLLHLRSNMPERSIIWVLGKDAYAGLANWQRVSELSNLCHLLVINRPGSNDAVNNDSQGFTQTEKLEWLQRAPAGYELQLELPMLEISSTRIRSLVAAGKSTRWLLPDVVTEYIELNKLYQQS